MQKTTFSLFSLLWGMALLLLCGTASFAQVPQARRSILGQGINVDRWLHHVDDNRSADPSFDPPTLTELLSRSNPPTIPKSSDLDYIRGLGLKHIRVPVSFSRLTNPANIGALRNGTNGTKNHLADLRSVISQITAKGMGVIVCPFDVPQSAWSSTGSSTGYQTFWRNLARELSVNPGQLTPKSAVL